MEYTGDVEGIANIFGVFLFSFSLYVQIVRHVTSKKKCPRAKVSYCSIVLLLLNWIIPGSLISPRNKKKSIQNEALAASTALLKSFAAAEKVSMYMYVSNVECCTCFECSCKAEVKGSKTDSNWFRFRGPCLLHWHVRGIKGQHCWSCRGCRNVPSLSLL